MQNRRDVKILLEHCIDERKYTPEISHNGEHTWEELDEQISLLTYFLNTGAIPNMDRYLQRFTSVFALWLLQKNTEFDDLVEELLENDN